MSADILAEPLALGLEKSLRDLEWGRIVDAVAERCAGPLGDRLDALPFASDVEGARRAMAETEEALGLRREGDPLPLSGIRDVRSSLDRVARSGALDGPSLRDVRLTLTAGRALRTFLARRKERCARLYAACPLDPTLDGLERELAAAIEPDGTVSDAASPELRRLRAEVGHLRARIIGRLEQILIEHRDVVQDRFHTVREGRYVVPMRTDAHDRIPGIVHGTSGSGATVFIEPRALVEQQNRLTLALGELEAEQARILAQLSELVGERLHELRAAVEALDHADLRSASARLAEDLRATVPELVSEATIDVKEGRHPLLLLDGVGVVPSDVSLRAGHALVLSGPNAGGKTVALKLLGTFAWMTRAGLPVPAAEGAVVGFFDVILSDVGDEQSLHKNLSTFSAHVRNLASFLDLAGPSTMVLLDEVATGTDPGEGAALACAVVDSLCRRGAAVAVTTHYEPLKAMALSDPRLRNASVGFDVERMAPTFQLRMDVPGASSALAVARRFGLDPLVIERATEMLPQQSRTFDALVRALEAAHERVTLERTGLEELRAKVERDRVRLDEELARLRDREQKKVREEAQRLLSLIRETRDDVRAARSAMRKQENDTGLIEAAKVAVERAAQRTREQGIDAAVRGADAVDERGVRATEDALVVGAKVWVSRLRAEVEIIEAPSRGKVRVASGAVKLWVGTEEVRVLGAAAPAVGRARVEASRSEVSERRAPGRTGSTRGEGAAAERTGGGPDAASGVVLRTTDNTVDLRGLRVDEAITLAESFLDRLYGRQERVGFLVHGVGTGALREALREHLKLATRYVRSFRAGSAEEGGERVTVVELT